MRLRLFSVLLLVPSLAMGGTIGGQVQTATGGAVKNGTLSFTLSQSAMSPGVGVLATTPVNCYTSNTGAIVGVPDPVVAPSVTASTASGSLPSGTYYVKIAYAGAGGTSAASPESTVVLGGTGTLTVANPVLQPAAATGYRVYISTTTGTETLQGTVTGWSSYQQSSTLTVGATPSTNSSTCAVAFSDELIPTTTWYQVNLVNSQGTQISGFPQNWCLFGGSGGSVNVSLGWPTGDCGTNGIVYPRLALETNGVFNGSQSLLNLQQGSGVTLTDDHAGTITVAATGGGGGGGTPADPNTSVQFNNSGAFGGSANFTWDGTQALVGVTNLQSQVGQGYFNIGQSQNFASLVQPINVTLHYNDSGGGVNYPSGTNVAVSLDQYGQLSLTNDFLGINRGADLTPGAGGFQYSVADAAGGVSEAWLAKANTIGAASTQRGVEGVAEDSFATNTDFTQFGGYFSAFNHQTSTAGQVGVYAEAVRDSPSTTASIKFIGVWGRSVQDGPAFFTDQGYLLIAPTTYSGLPACTSNTEGGFYPIRDATVNTWGATISAGGGTNHVAAYCDGTNWTVAAK